MSKKISLIHQPGEIGSSSLKHLLHKSDQQFKVYHVHKFFFTDLERKLKPKEVLLKLKCIVKLFVYVNILKWEVNIIGGFRDTSKRSVSSFFQNHKLKYKRTPEFLEELCSLFEKERVMHDNTINWFSGELYRRFGIDIYS